MSLSVAILAGGMATRLHPLTLTKPKSLITINQYPFIGWQLKLLASSGITRAVLCLGHKANEIMDFVGDGNQFGIEIRYSVEEEPLGTGGALRNAESLLEDSFGVLYGDSYLPINFLRVFQAFSESRKSMLMTIFKNDNSFDKSNVMIDKHKNVKYSKKNFQPGMKYIDYGFIVMKKSALSAIQKSTFSDLSDLTEKLSKANDIEAYEIRERFYEIGSFKGIVDLEGYLKGEQK